MNGWVLVWGAGLTLWVAEGLEVLLFVFTACIAENERQRVLQSNLVQDFRQVFSSKIVAKRAGDMAKISCYT